MDDSRFVAAVSPYIKDMLHLAITLIGVSNAEDAAQEALLRAWRAASTLREGDTVRAWLLRIRRTSAMIGAAGARALGRT